jgi:hypothetical protein
VRSDEESRAIYDSYTRAGNFWKYIPSQMFVGVVKLFQFCTFLCCFSVGLVISKICLSFICVLC